MTTREDRMDDTEMNELEQETGPGGLSPSSSAPFSANQPQPLEASPWPLQCPSCQSMVVSRVTEKTKGFICGLDGFRSGHIPVTIMAIFREFHHACPKCDAALGISEGKTNMCQVGRK